MIFRAIIDKSQKALLTTRRRATTTREGGSAVSAPLLPCVREKMQGLGRAVRAGDLARVRTLVV